MSACCTPHLTVTRFFFTRCGTTLLKTRSNSFGSSLASAALAVSRNRFDSSGSSHLGFVLRGIGNSIPRKLHCCHSRTKKNASCGSSGNRARICHTRTNLVRGFLRSSCATRFFVGQPLTLGTLQGEFGPLFVVNPTPISVRIPEIKFRQIAMKVGFAHVVINANNTALKDRKVVFDSIAMGITAHVFERTVVNHFMSGKTLTNTEVSASGISHERGPEIGVGLQDGPNGRAIHLRDVVRADATAALDKRMNDLLEGVSI